VQTFNVSSTVSEDSVWGRKGLVGYSSVGKIVEGRARDDDLIVECVRADDELPADAQVSFVKLDLQGGEPAALRGMPEVLRDVLVMWVEHSGDPELLRVLEDFGFDVYDTEYMFHGAPSKGTAELFDVSRDQVTLSTGKQAWYGFRRVPWVDYESELRQCKRRFGLIQTDLICVNRRFTARFDAALAALDIGE